MKFKLNKFESKRIILLMMMLSSGIAVWGCGSEKNLSESPGTQPTATQQGQMSGQGDRKVLYWQAPMDPTEIYDHPGKSKMGMDLIPVYEKQTSPQGERKVLYWQAPMDPTEIYDHPGKSKMGMDLVPVYADESTPDASGMVRIDPVTVQNMGVRSAKVKRGDFTRSIRTVGQIEYNEERLFIVSTKISGWIERLYVNYVGEMVRKGDPLLEIYSPQLVTTQEEYLLALETQKKLAKSEFGTVRDGAQTLFESSRKRLLYWDIPMNEINRLEKTGEVRKTVQLEAPVTGMVVQRNAIQGAHVNEGTSLLQITDLSTVWVHASIYDYELPWIREGQTARMDLSYLPGKTFAGKVAYIYPYLREEARDVHIRLEFPNPNLELKIGMFANIDIQAPVIPDAIMVPTEAVIRSGARNVVFVVRDEGRFEPRQVVVGEEGNNDMIRVISGLSGNERVVVSAQFLIDSESRLQEAIQKMLAERQQSSKM